MSDNEHKVASTTQKPRPSLLDLFDPLASAHNSRADMDPDSPTLRSPSPDSASSDKENDTPAPSRTYKYALNSPRKPSPKAAARLVDVSLLLDALRSDVAEESDGEVDVETDVEGNARDDTGTAALKNSKRVPLAEITLALEQPAPVTIGIAVDGSPSLLRDARLASSISSTSRSFAMASASLAFSSPPVSAFAATASYGPASRSPFTSPERRTTSAPTSCGGFSYAGGSPTRAPASSPLASVINAINFSTAHSSSPLSNSHSFMHSPYSASRPSPLKRAISLPRSEDSEEDEHGFLRQDTDDGDALPVHYSEFDLDEVEEENDENGPQLESPLEMEPAASVPFEGEGAPATLDAAPMTTEGASDAQPEHVPDLPCPSLGGSDDVQQPEVQEAFSQASDALSEGKVEITLQTSASEECRISGSEMQFISVSAPPAPSSPPPIAVQPLANTTEPDLSAAIQRASSSDSLSVPAANITPSSTLSISDAAPEHHAPRDLISTLAFGSSTAELIPSSQSASLLNVSTLHGAEASPTMDYTGIIASIKQKDVVQGDQEPDGTEEQSIIVRAPTPPVLHPSPPKSARPRESLTMGRPSLDPHSSFNLSSQLHRIGDVSFDLLHGGMSQSFLKQMEDEAGADVTFDLEKEERGMENVLRDVVDEAGDEGKSSAMSRDQGAMMLIL
jgi:hypothetical protein